MGAYDIRRNAVRTTHIIDESVLTEKLSDLSVTVEKTEEPLFITALSELGLTNPTATYQLICSVDIDVPTWASKLSIFALGRQQATNSTGSQGNVETTVVVGDDSPGSAASSTTIQNNETGTSIFGLPVDLVVAPGSTVTVNMWSKFASGSSSNGFGRLWVLAVGSR